jgi:hypothetical protein
MNAVSGKPADRVCCATLRVPKRISNYMSGMQIVRGTAALPADVEEQFVRAHGREMTLEERRFFGLAPQDPAKVYVVEPQQNLPKAA